MQRDSGVLAPTTSASRLESLDLLRGIALLGILLMNIRLFAMVQAAYFNPTAYGDLSSVNYWIFALNHVLSDQKFMTLFSVLFGAGIVLMAERAEARGVSPVWIHYRRTFWLLILGALHAYLLWYGDILVIYSLSAFLVIWFWRRRPRTQFIFGLLMLAVSTLLYLAADASLPQWPAEARADALAGWSPTPDQVATELAIYRGGWVGQLEHRMSSAFEFHTVVFLFWGLWRAGGLMLIGMALYRWGVLSASLSTTRYRTLAFVGLGLGLPIVSFGLFQHEAHGWDFDYSFFVGSQYNYWGSLLVSLGYLALVMLWFQSGHAKALRHRLSAVGRTAFSCYIAQTVICTTLFYGHGLGWFGYAERWQQMMVVLGVWGVLLIAAPWWLARYRFGPLEWLWRSLTYWQLQPLRR